MDFKDGRFIDDEEFDVYVPEAKTSVKALKSDSPYAIRQKAYMKVNGGHKPNTSFGVNPFASKADVALALHYEEPSPDVLGYAKDIALAPIKGMAQFGASALSTLEQGFAGIDVLSSEAIRYADLGISSFLAQFSDEAQERVIQLTDPKFEEALRDVQSERMKQSETYSKKMSDAIGLPEGLPKDIISGTGSVGTSLLFSTTGGPLATAGFYGLSSAGSQFVELNEAGEGLALPRSLMGGTISGWANTIGDKAIINSIVGRTAEKIGLKSLGKAILKGGSGEFIEEGVEALAENINLQDARELTWQDVAVDSLYQAAVGGIVGAFLGGAGNFAYTKFAPLTENIIEERLVEAGLSESEAKIMAHDMAKATTSEKMKQTLLEVLSDDANPIKYRDGSMEADIDYTIKQIPSQLESVLLQSEMDMLPSQTIQNPDVEPISLPETITLSGIEFKTEETPHLAGLLFQMAQDGEKVETLADAINAVSKRLDIEGNQKMAYELDKAKQNVYSKLQERFGEEYADTASEVAKANIYAGARMLGISPSEYLQKFFADVKTTEYKDFLQRTGRYEEQAKTKRAKKNVLDVFQAIRKLGGIKPSDQNVGDVRTLLDKGTFALLNERTGVSLDDIRQGLIDLGFLFEQEGEATTTIQDVLDLIERQARGEKVYPLNYVEETQSQEDFDESVFRAEVILDENVVDYSQMSDKQKIDVATEVMNLNDYLKKYSFTEENMPITLEEKRQAVAELQASEDYIPFQTDEVNFDALFPEYTGETININGVERPVYNSEGNRIAKSKEALINFYKWFGDSKVVDEQGRPLVVYHGTKAKWNTYDFSRVGQSFAGFSAHKGGAYFTSNKQTAGSWGRQAFGTKPVIVMPMYLSLQNPKIYENMHSDFPSVEELKKQGFDGIIDRATNYPSQDVVAFSPNQIKSINNRGTYSLDEDNIYWQFVGEKAETVDLDKLSLAKTLNEQGVSNEEIRQKTGWFLAKDKKWRYEISDKNSKINDDGLKELETEGIVKLKDLLSDDNLYNAYPDLKNMRVTKQFIGQALALFNGHGIVLSERLHDKKTIRSVLKHELQHAIQKIEEFAKGGNPEMFSTIEDLKKDFDFYKRQLDFSEKWIEQAEDLDWTDKTIIPELSIDNNHYTVGHVKELKNEAQSKLEELQNEIDNYETPFEKYKKLLGEAEANDVQERLNMTDKQRKNWKNKPKISNLLVNDYIAIMQDGSVFYQSAYAGSRVDYDKPSLEAIGSGEGVQAHGWGLYYALNRDVAEGYRETFTQDKFVLKYGDKTYTKEDGAIFDALNDTWFAGSKEEAIDGLQTRLDLKQYEDLDERDDIKKAIAFLENVDANKIELAPQGQVHEVDIPENPYLLDEQLQFSEQPEIVKEAINKIKLDKNIGITKDTLVDVIENHIKKLQDEFAMSDFNDLNIEEDIKASKYDLHYAKEGGDISGLLTYYQEVSTGADLYEILSKQLGSDKDASLLLEKYGVKGITYEGGRDGRCFVIFNPDDVKVIQKFYQEQGGFARGAFDPVSNTIYLFEKANRSTFMHEMAHNFLNVVYEGSMRGIGSAVEMKKDIDEWLGHKGGAYIEAEHERFARGFEQFLLEGKSPNNKLKKAFSAFKRWLINIYKSVRGIGLDLSDDIRQVYSEMLGGRDYDKIFESNQTLKTLEENIGAIEERARQIAEARTNYAKEVAEDLVNSKEAQSKVRNAFSNYIKQKKESAGLVHEALVAGFTPLSTRAKEISPVLMLRMRDMMRRQGRFINDKMAKISPLLDGVNKMSDADKIRFDSYMKNGVQSGIEELCKKHGLTEQYQSYREAMDEIYDEASSVGIKINYREVYAPRKIKDKQAFLEFIRNSNAGLISQMDAEIGAGASIDEQAEWLDSHLYTWNLSDPMTATPANAKERTIDVIDKEIDGFYYSTTEAIASYVDGMSQAIVMREVFGATRDADGTNEGLNKSIGEIIAHLREEGKITTNKQAEEVRKIMNSLLMNHGVQSKILSRIKSGSMAVLLTRFTQTLSQLADIGTSIKQSGFSSTLRGFFGNDITMEDIGLEKLTEEYRKKDGLHKQLDFLFKISGFNAMDKFGKSTYLNGRWDYFQKMAKNNPEKLKDYLEPMFEDRTDSLFNDIKNGRVSEDVKLLMFSEISDIQPTTLAEMPSGYVNNPNGRILYMLKTFTLRRLDFVLNQTYRMAKSGKKAQAFKNLAAIALWLGGFEALVALLKDFLRGRELSITDNMLDAMMGIFMINRYQMYKAREEGWSGFASTLIPPMFPMADAIGSDATKIIKGKIEPKDLKVWSYMPLIGDAYYWWFGGGLEKNKKKRKKR